MARDTSLVGKLIEQLQGLGVELPGEVLAGWDQLRRVEDLRPKPVVQRVLGLSDEQVTATIRSVGLAHALTPSDANGPGSHALREVRQAFFDELTEAIVDEADELLSQLRPNFDAAGEMVHEATQLGIGPSTTDRDIVTADDIEAMRDAWTALPGLVSTLDRIAAVRILMSQSTGLAPTPADPQGWGQASHFDMAPGAMFRSDAPPWRQEREQTWQTWLRLCTPEPVRLLSVEETVKALEGVHV